MIGKICGQSFGAGGGSVSGNWGQGDLNHVLVVSDAQWRDDDYLTVQLVSPLHERIVVVNRVSMTKLAGVSQIRSGYNADLQALLNILSGNYVAATSGGSPTVQLLPSFDVLNWCVGLDLGCLKMQATDSELQVTLERGAAVAEMSVHALFLDDGPDVIKTWLESSLPSDSFTNCEELYVVSLADYGDPSPSNKSVNVLVHSPYGSYLTDAQGAFGASGYLGEASVHGPVNAALVYKSADSLLGSVSGQMTGSSVATDSLSWIACQRYMNVKRVSRGTIQATASAVGRLSNKTMDERRALTRAGLSPTLQRLVEISKTLNTGEN